MRTSLALIAACALIGCGKPEPAQAPLTEHDRMEKLYNEWAAQVPRPTPEIVDRIEALLVKEPCIGDINRWSRFYAYDMPEKTVDTGIVDFHLEEAGTLGIKPGRQITVPSAWVNLDSRPIKMVGGDYDLKEDRIRVGFCGNNVGPTQSAVDKMRRYWGDLDRRRAAHGTKAQPAVRSSHAIYAEQTGQ